MSPRGETTTERLESRVRRSWTESPGPLLRSAAVLYGAAVDTRNLMYDLGVRRVRQAPVPVVSVGGLTAGGSGKTPIAAEIARWAVAEGWRPVLVTPGLSDEMAVHEFLNPEIPVVGGRHRLQLIQDASNGSNLAILDSGFQHRRLARDVEIVALDAVSLAGSRRRLPAGPFRERLAELRRADIVMIVRRDAARRAGAPAQEEAQLARWVRGLDGVGVVAGVRIAPGPLVPANDTARGTAGVAPPRPAVAVAGVMYPAPFFDSVAHRLSPDGAGAPPFERVGLPDHFAYGEGDIRGLLEVAGERGIACTLKDAVKLVPLVGERTPVWYLAERVEADGPLRELVAGALRGLRDDERAP